MHSTASINTVAVQLRSKSLYFRGQLIEDKRI